MQELIETIRTAVATGANTDQKAAGATACRTILTALDTEPGKPLTAILPPSVAPSGSPLQGLSKLSLDQMLDLMIARLTTIANTRETSQPTPVVQRLPAGAKLEQASRGLRVPASLPKSVRVAPKTVTNSRQQVSKR